MKTYGAKCHRCACLLGPTHDVEPAWPVTYGECANCEFCQENALMRALKSAGPDLFSPEVRDALSAFRRGEPHPLIDQLRAEIQAIEEAVGEEGRTQ